MKEFSSCKSAISECIDHQTFAVAHLYNNEKTMHMHIHDCSEIYYSISGGKQFLIDDRFYNFNPGDIFFINQFESHHLSQIDSEKHERIIISIHPEYLHKLSTPQTDLNYCFSHRKTNFGHKISLTPKEQKHFQYYIHKLTSAEGFGQELLEQAAFLELMIFLNKSFQHSCRHDLLQYETVGSHYEQMNDILSYINQNITNDLSIKTLAEHFFISTSHLCKLFKSETGTTINKYITAKRITLAKALLIEGNSVTEVCSLSGFKDYSNFFKTFTKTVGISPKKYAQFSV